MTHSKSGERDVPQLSPWLLECVQCPITKSRLEIAQPTVLEQIAKAVVAGTLVNRVGVTIVDAISGGLVCESGAFFYSIHNGIPTLIPEEAIDLSQLSPARR